MITTESAEGLPLDNRLAKSDGLQSLRFCLQYTLSSKNFLSQEKLLISSCEFINVVDVQRIPMGMDPAS